MGLMEVLKSRRDLLKIEIDTEDWAGSIDLFEELIFDHETLEEHIQVQAGMISWYSAVYRASEVAHNRLKRDYDLWFTPRYEREFTRLWKEMGYTKSNKPNISSTENAVKVRYKKEYLAWTDKLEEARLQMAIMEDVVNWWTEKGRMLVQAAKFAHGESMDIFRQIREGSEMKSVKKLTEAMAQIRESEEASGGRKMKDKRILQ